MRNTETENEIKITRGIGHGFCVNGKPIPACQTLSTRNCFSFRKEKPTDGDLEAGFVSALVFMLKLNGDTITNSKKMASGSSKTKAY